MVCPITHNRATIKNSPGVVIAVASIQQVFEVRVATKGRS